MSQIELGVGSPSVASITGEQTWVDEEKSRICASPVCKRAHEAKVVERRDRQKCPLPVVSMQ